jgi:hypothetical protein
MAKCLCPDVCSAFVAWRLGVVVHRKVRVLTSAATKMHALCEMLHPKFSDYGVSSSWFLLDLNHLNVVLLLFTFAFGRCL